MNKDLNLFAQREYQLILNACNTFIIGGGDGNSLGLRKSSTRMVALIITNFKGFIGSSYKCLSEIGIFFHLADSSID